MRMRWAVMTLGLAMAGGCGGDPAVDALRAGTEAVVATADRAGLRRGDDWRDTVYLDPGVRVLVGHDPELYVETDDSFQMRLAAAKSPQEAEEIKKEGLHKGKRGEALYSLRSIKVTVESGEHKGLSGEIIRSELRPIQR